MRDLAIELAHRPGALAEMGEALGNAGVSVEGGGVFAAGGVGVAHFLIADGDLAAAREALAALEGAGIRFVADREVIDLKLRQDVPGQLGAIGRRMAEAGVNIEVQYSDHDHNLILVVDAPERAREVAARWTSESADARRA